MSKSELHRIEKVAPGALAELRERIAKETEKAFWELFNINSEDQSELAGYRRRVITAVREVIEPIARGSDSRDSGIAQ